MGSEWAEDTNPSPTVATAEKLLSQMGSRASSLDEGSVPASTLFQAWETA